MGTVTDQQRKAWNTFSSGWEKWDTFVLGILEPIGAKLLDEIQLRSTDTVLDVSTGTGEPGLTAATSVKRVAATDVAKGMVEIASQNAFDRKLKNYKAIVADAEELPFGTASFDAVTCRLGVMFFGDPQAGVNEMARVLKRGRKVSIAAWTSPSENPWATLCSSAVEKLMGIESTPLDAPGLFRHSRSGSLSHLLRDADLTHVTQQKIQGSWKYESPEQYWEFVTDVVAPVAIPLMSADKNMRDKVRNAVISGASKYLRNGKVEFKWGCWIATGMK